MANIYDPTNFQRIHQAAVAAEAEHKRVKTSLIEAANKIRGIRSRALAIASVALSEPVREVMTNQFIRDMLALQVPDCVSEDQLEKLGSGD